MVAPLHSEFIPHYDIAKCSLKTTYNMLLPMGALTIYTSIYLFEKINVFEVVQKTHFVSYR